MKFFRGVSQTFIIMSVALAIFEVVYSGVTNAKMKVRTTAEFWKDLSPDAFIKGKHSLQSMFSTEITMHIMNLYIPLLVLIIGLLFYIIYRLIFMIKGGDKSQLL